MIPTILKGEAARWFGKLPPHSVTSLADLSKKLLQRFKQNWTKPEAVDHLFNIVRQEGKSTRKYLARFRQAVADVENLDDSVVIKAFTRGTKYRQGDSTNTSLGTTYTPRHTFLPGVKKYLEKEDEY